MQRSRITSAPKSGLRSSVRTSSRSSMIFVGTRRDASSARRSFSSTRTRERSTPTRASFTPVFLRLGREREYLGNGFFELELGAAVGARQDLAFHRVGAHGHVRVALRALRHAFPLHGRGNRRVAGSRAR